MKRAFGADRVWRAAVVGGLRTNTVAVTAPFTGPSEGYEPFFGTFGAAWDDAMVTRWSANPFGNVLAGDARWIRGWRWRRRLTGWSRRPVVVIAAG